MLRIVCSFLFLVFVSNFVLVSTVQARSPRPFTAPANPFAVKAQKGELEAPDQPAPDPGRQAGRLSEPAPSVPKPCPWYKTTAGVVLLTIGSLLAATGAAAGICYAAGCFTDNHERGVSRTDVFFVQ